MALCICLAIVFFVIGEANIVLAGGVLVVATIMMGCGVVINLDRKKSLAKDGFFAQTIQKDGKTITCTDKDGQTWSFAPQTWAKWIFEDRRPPIKTKQNAK